MQQPMILISSSAMHITGNYIASRIHKCYTCGATIKVSTVRHSPDPCAITNYYCTILGMSVSINKEDKICKNCYNVQLAILKEYTEISFDEELKYLLCTYIIEDDYEDYIKLSIRRHAW